MRTMVKPMLASSARTIPENNKNIVMEPKFDGWRAILDQHNGEGVALRSRTGKPILAVPYIQEAFHNLLPNSTLDGEIVDLVGEPGRQWNRTQELLSRKSVHVPSTEDPPLTYVVFDMLELNGQSLLRRPLSERRQLLEALVALMPEGVPVQISPQFPADEEGFDRLVNAGWEGVVCKRLDAPYSPGARGRAWMKIKPEQEVDVIVTGTFPPAPGSKFDGSAVGGFTFEATHPENFDSRSTRIFTVRGKCGTGMDNALREDLLANEAHYVGKVAVVGHAGIAPGSGALRFPSLIRFRDDADKSATDVRAVLNDEAGSTKINLLNRALQAEEERDEYKDKWEDARDKLAGAVKKAVTSGKPRTGGYKRNYGAMGEEKLVVTIAELRHMVGDSYNRVIERGGDPHAELVRAEENARGRGIAIGVVT